ncbi:hypothetical protein [Marinicella litoralis]|uniref:Uncharacterized protein n=1 Tax=Marinicella litoralis TaxID=644220 RepID=A0A4R6XY52_9GAMM|nr:hypothetical protein [Marinicella litoralis]TDR23214.1 hypothetical protein C8D91_0074 [Marinicella litoralis]
MKTLLLIILFFGLSACGSNTKDRVAAVKVGDELYKPDRSAAMAIDTGSKERLVCERRIVTGSHRKEKVCSTVAERERERKAAQETINSGDVLNNRRIIESKGDNL